MNAVTMQVLEFNKVLEQIESYALSEAARNRIRNLQPSTNLDQIQIWMEETSQARKMVDANASVPLAAMETIEEVMNKLGKAVVLSPDELKEIEALLEAVKKMRRYMNTMEYVAAGLSAYAASMFELADLREEISRCIFGGRVDDRASSDLHRVRRKIMITRERVREKLQEILRSPNYAGMLQEAVISERNGRYVIPIKRQHRKSFPGSAVETSGTGSTVFMEPAAVNRLQAELSALRDEEEKEVYRILVCLTGAVETAARELAVNIEAMVHYDFVFAKARYSQSRDMKAVQFNNDGYINLVQARHPLLQANAVPLDFIIGQDYRALLITGPNTGGKTVALKNIGLLCLMGQAGLHLPAGEGSQLAVFTDILADIGDGQSIEQSLSTFSAHVKNLLTIMECAASDTLVIMDELGAGTDPAEGRGFARAVLEEVYAQGATIIATTHFGELKEFAAGSEGFENASMEFDAETLQPLYRLNIGTWGESQAFAVALRLGVEVRIIERAHEISYGEYKHYPSGSLQETVGIKDQEAIDIHEETRRALEKQSREKEKRTRGKKYLKKELKTGDRVFISTMKRTGIVCEEENERGELVVMVMGKKYRINAKRLTLHIDREQLYPDDYDMDILFETKENRKARKMMKKRHVEGLIIEKEPNADENDE